MMTYVFHFFLLFKRLKVLIKYLSVNLEIGAFLVKSSIDSKNCYLLNIYL